MRKLRAQPDPAELEPLEELPARGPDSIDRMIAAHGAERICAALEPLMSAERIARIDAVLDARLASIIPVVEDVYDPHNGAAVIRSAEALGLQELHVLETGLRFQAAKGITRGCHRWMDLVRWREPQACVTALRARGFRVFATTLAPGAVPADEIDVSRPVAVVFGNEHRGLPDATVAACDGAVVLPMYGFTQSYNLSVSAAMLTSQLAARRRALLGRAGDLDDDRRRHLRARWFALGLRGVAGIVERTLGVAPGPQAQ